MIRRVDARGVPMALARFDESEWPGVTYAESFGEWQAAWDTWQVAHGGVGEGAHAAASLVAYIHFPDEPFDPYTDPL